MKRTQRNTRRLRLQTLEERRLLAAGPYAPAAGLPGSTAIAIDDAAIVSWASSVADYSPGSDVDPQWQDASQALGKAEGVFDRVVSLGRGGSLTLQFDTPIRDGLGPDFAVFENAVNDTFLELGFVEVSSDGVNFVRFASDSLTPAPVASFGSVDPTNVNNLAGKYRGGFGTPFDLEELRGQPRLDVTSVTHVRLVDIVGDGKTRDASGNPIYDPTPTFQSAGMDIDGVGVIHQVATGEVVIDFETLGAGLGPSGFDNGSGANGFFQENEITLNNDYSTQFQSWSGWAISQSGDNTTAGFTNQFGNITGEGAGSSETFAIGFFDVSPSGALPPPTITLDPTSGSRFDSIEVTNATYAALSMRNGDSFAKKFGGDSGNDPDFLRLTVTGVDAAGNSVGSVMVMLADYRFADNSQDYILDAWTRIDVSSLAAARSLRFSLDGSDVSTFGLNTPAFFALDNVTLRRAAVPFDLETTRTREDEPVLARVSRPTADMSSPFTVTLQPSNTDFATLPETVTIAANVPYAEFTIVPVDDTLPSADRSFEITASAANLLPTLRTLEIEDDEQLAIEFSASLVNVTEGAGVGGGSLVLSRNDSDVSGPLAVTLSHETTSLLGIPATASFAAGERQLTIPINVFDDGLFTGDIRVLVTATAPGRLPATSRIVIADNDLPAIVLQPNSIRLSEIEPQATQVLTVARNTDDLTSELVVTLTLPDGGPISIPSEVTIPAGEASVPVTIGVIADGAVNALPAYRVHASNANMMSATVSVEVVDQPKLRITTTDQSLFESDATRHGDFEALGRGLVRGEFDNNAGSSGAFVSGPFALANSFDNSFGFDVWSGFAISRGADRVTPGFANQYSAITGIGAGGSSTYAVAYANAAVTISRPEDSTSFASLDVTNTTYAALAMRDGDDFSKKFGGDSDDEPDYLLLTIDGLDEAGNSIGRVDFYLADFRFEDNSLDYIIDQWTTLDVSSIGDAQTLSMSMSSSDNGAWGMNTPAYFAIDNLMLAHDPAFSLMITIERLSEETSTPLEVDLSGEGEEVNVPDRVTIPAGQTQVSVPTFWLNDEIAKGPRTWNVSASAIGFSGAESAITLVDDETEELTLTLSADTVNESDGVQTIGFEDVGETLAEQSFDKGENGRGGFDSGSLFFPTDYNPTWGSWSGWAASNRTDVTTPGFENQFSAYAENSSTFAVAGGYGSTPPTLSLLPSISGATFESIAITNTTYAALSMLQGDSFAKRFGGETGTDPDFFLLTIDGVDAAGDSVGTIDFYLADYRSEDPESDYVVDDWTTVDLTPLVGATSLQFGLSSSDVGSFGMNTPAFFAIDDLVVTRATETPSIVVHRNANDLSNALRVSLSSSNPARLTVASPIVIPAGESSVRVPLTVVDDAIYHASETIVIASHASGLPDAEATIRLVEDDLPRVLVDPTIDNLAIEEGSQAGVFSVRLQTPPLDGPLLVSIEAFEPGSEAPNRLELSTQSLTFTSDNWDQPQTVSVAGRIDLIAQPLTVIGLRLRDDREAYAPETMWVELADYQPVQLSLRSNGDFVELIDDVRDWVFGRYESGETLEVVLSGVAQQITLHPLAENADATIRLGGGDDIAFLHTDQLTLLDGGDGEDTVVISLDGDVHAVAPVGDEINDTGIDVAAWLSSKIVNFETIVLGSDDLATSAPVNRFVIDAEELSRLFGDAVPRLVTTTKQTIKLVGQWQLDSPTIENGNVVANVTSEGVRIAVANDRPWRNWLLAADVNGSGDVTSVDALTVINRLNADPSTTLPVPQTGSELPTMYYDVSGDGRVTSLDALQVINWLNSQPLHGSADPEGESLGGDFPMRREPMQVMNPLARSAASAPVFELEPAKKTSTDLENGNSFAAHAVATERWTIAADDAVDDAANDDRTDAIDAVFIDSDWLTSNLPPEQLR